MATIEGQKKTVAQLAEEIVDARLAYLLSDVDRFIDVEQSYGAPGADAYLDWEQLVAAINAEHKSESDDEEQLDHYRRWNHARAGFLVGLALGRRLAGGAR